METASYLRSPSKWLDDGLDLRLTYEQQGIYTAMMDRCWVHGSIEVDPCSRLRISSQTFTDLWPVIEKYFERRDDVLVHPEIEMDRVRLEAFRNQKKTAGKLGGLAKASNRLATLQQNPSAARAALAQKASDALAEGLADPSPFPSPFPSPSGEGKANTVNGSTPPHTGVPPPAAPSGQVYDPDFEIFWTAYPKKEAKPKAFAAWKKQKPPVNETLSAIAKARGSAQWTKPDEHGVRGAFIPLPASWLNQRRWEDQPLETNQNGKPRPGVGWKPPFNPLPKQEPQ